MPTPEGAALLLRDAADAEERGPVFELVEPFDADNLRADALALRLMAAVHRLVLTGAAPRFAVHYPTAGGRAGTEGAWEAFREVVVAQADALRPLVALPCQTNEVGRCAALAFGFLELAAATAGRCGCSRWARARASTCASTSFATRRRGFVGASRQPCGLVGLAVRDRRGCDLRPIDIGTDGGRLQLESSLWADQTARLARLRGAFAVAASCASRRRRPRAAML